MMNSLRSVARRVLPTEVRHVIREIVYGPRVDEVALVHRFFEQDHEPSDEPRVMVDVGAHRGASLEAFARDGWERPFAVASPCDGLGASRRTVGFGCGTFR